MSAHARIPLDPDARIAPDKLDHLADNYEAVGHPAAARALRQAASDARLIAALETWLEAEMNNATEHGWAVRLETLEDVRAQMRDLRCR